MMRLKVTVTLLAIVALLGTACSSRRVSSAEGRPVPGASGAASASPKASHSPLTDPFGRVVEAQDPHGHAEGDKEEEKEVSSMYSAKNPPSTEFRRADTGESATGSERIQLALRIVPGCAELGSVVRVTARTKPDARVGLLSNVPTQQGKASESDGRSDANGYFEWLLQIPSNTAVGNFEIMAAAADDKGPDGGRSGDWLFVVAAPGGCS
jgi:hypothetical protein